MACPLIWILLTHEWTSGPWSELLNWLSYSVVVVHALDHFIAYRSCHCRILLKIDPIRILDIDDPLCSAADHSASYLHAFHASLVLEQPLWVVGRAYSSRKLFPSRCPNHSITTVQSVVYENSERCISVSHPLRIWYKSSLIARCFCRAAW